MMSSISIYVFLSCHFDIPVIFLQMRFNCRWGLKVIPFLALLLIVLYYFWSPSNTLGVAIQPRQGSRIQKLLIEKSQSIITDYSDIPYKIKENVARCQYYYFFP